MINPEAYIRFKDIPNFQSMFGNIGNSWINPSPNDLYIKGVSKTILREAPATASGNVGGGEDTILAYSILAGSLKIDLDYVKGVIAGGIAGNDNNKAVRFYVNGVQLIGPTTIDLDGPQGWVLRFEIIRKDATHVIVSADLSIDALAIDSGGVVTISSGIFMQSLCNVVTVSNLASNDLPISVTGEGTSDNDVTKMMTIIELCRQ